MDHATGLDPGDEPLLHAVGYMVAGALLTGVAWWCKAVFRVLYRPLP